MLPRSPTQEGSAERGRMDPQASPARRSPRGSGSARRPGSGSEGPPGGRCGEGPRCEAAASEVLGSALTIAITVALAAGVLGLFLGAPPPVAAPHVDLALTLDAGEGGWGTGDEAAVLAHRGGERLDRERTAVRLLVGGDAYAYEAGALAGGFADGALTVGETWQATLDIPAGAVVRVGVTAGGVLAAALEGTSPAGGDCSADAAQPTVGVWVQEPSDVHAGTTGAVSVGATASDGCAGVDTDAAPSLHYRINDGSSPAYTNLGAMTHAGGTTWTGTIPDPGWSSKVGQTLQYYVATLRDHLGNAGPSATRSDVVQVSGAATYPGSWNATTGSLANLAAAQSGTDGGAEATLAEGAVAGTHQTLTLAAASVLGSSTWTNPANAYASDNLHASTTSTTPGLLQLGLGDPSAPLPASVTGVVLKAEVSIVTGINDAFRLQACFGATCSAVSGDLLAPGGVETTVSYNVTTLRPGGGAWTPADLASLDLTVHAVPVLGRDGEWRVDRAWAEVQVVTATTYSLGARVNFTSVPSASLHALELRYRVASPGDSFHVHVHDGTAWATRGTQLTATSATDWTYQLTNAEWNGGAPRIHLVDATPGGTDQGTLFLDHARVVSG